MGPVRLVSASGSITVPLRSRVALSSLGRLPSEWRSISVFLLLGCRSIVRVMKALGFYDVPSSNRLVALLPLALRPTQK